MLSMEDRGPFVMPALVVAMDGWVNAGSAGTMAADVAAAGGEVVARLDPDEMYDFRMLRPTVTFNDGVIVEVEWPETNIRRITIDGRDILFMSGPEPNWRWRRLGDELVAACLEWGVVEFIGIGGVPWAAPHTRPVSVMATSTSGDRLQGGSGAPDGIMQVPGAAVSAIEHRMHQEGLATIGFWARVPNYVGSAYPAAAQALLERLGNHLGISLDTGELAVRAAEHLTQLDDAIDERPDVRTMVTQLEELYDSTSAVSGDDLAAEIEKFLREQR